MWNKFASRLKKGNQGYTLLEIMIAVAIVGIGVSMAVPQYQLQTARARQSEAKIGLSGLYTAQKSYSAEFNTFTACIRRIGFKPESSRFYAIGFQTYSSPPVNCGPDGDGACINDMWDEDGDPTGTTQGCPSGYAANQSFYAAMKKSYGSIPLATGADLGATPDTTSGWSSLAGSYVSRNQFKLYAVGNVSSKSSYDRWYIDHNKNMLNIRSGL